MDSSIRYPDPLIKVNDTVKIDLTSGKITEFIQFDTGVVAMVTGGRNMGRVGVITHRERHDGGFNIVHIKDAIDNSFATRESNVFIIGREKPWISLPKGKGVKVSYENEIDRSNSANSTSCRSPRREIAGVQFRWPVTKLATASTSSSMLLGPQQARCRRLSFIVFWQNPGCPNTLPLVQYIRCEEVVLDLS